MFFVFFPIDLIYLDSSGKVVEIRAKLAPWRIHTPKADSNYLLELPEGTVAKIGVKLGHQVNWGKGFNL